jgi:hypothetical protein
MRSVIASTVEVTGQRRPAWGPEKQCPPGVKAKPTLNRHLVAKRCESGIAAQVVNPPQAWFSTGVWSVG